MRNVRRGIEDWIRLSLKRKVNIEEGRQRLNGNTMLGVIEEIALAVLVTRIPFKYVELRIIGTVGGL